MSQASTLNPVEEVVEFFARGPSREEIASFRLSDAAQERLRELLHTNAAGQATPEEDRELDQMVLLDDIVSLIRARVQRSARSHLGSAGSTDA
jgi:hypothetical protein